MKKSLVTYKGKEINTPAKKLLVKLNKPEDVTPSGIIIPNTAKKETDFTGVIVAVSRGMEESGSHIIGENAIVLRNAGVTSPTDDESNLYKTYKESEIKWHGF